MSRDSNGNEAIAIGDPLLGREMSLKLNQDILSYQWNLSVDKI